MADSADGHVAVTRRLWDERMSAWFERYARSRWASAEPYWGMWCIPQSRLPVLPAGLADVVAAELGCGSGYVSAWLARRGARPVGESNGPPDGSIAGLIWETGSPACFQEAIAPGPS